MENREERLDGHVYKESEVPYTLQPKNVTALNTCICRVTPHICIHESAPFSLAKDHGLPNQIGFPTTKSHVGVTSNGD